MKPFLTYLMAWLLPGIIFAQADSVFRFVRTISGDIRSITADHLDNLYLIDRKDQVKKVGPKGDSLAVYNDVRRLGSLSGIDVANPMQPMLYYGDGVRFVVLDRFLNPATRIDLQSIGIPQLKTWTRSYDNQLWIFDPIAYALKKVDLAGQVQWATPDFRLILGKPFSPVRMADQDRNLYLYHPDQGVYVFDYFGNLKNGIQLLDWLDWQVDGAYIYGCKADTLYRYEIKSTYYDEWLLPHALRGAEQYLIRGSTLYALFREGIQGRVQIYSIH